MCEAVHAAHLKNIIHRDLKPDNIIVQQTASGDEVKVLDFGIAKLREYSDEEPNRAPQTRHGMLVGTPQYMSPEQCKGTRGDDLKPTSDIYSIGVIAFEMLSGRLPFSASSTLGYLSQHVNEAAPALHLYAPNVPRALESVVMKALQKDPLFRQQNAADLARLLRLALKEADQISGTDTLKLPLGPQQTEPMPSPPRPTAMPPRSRETEDSYRTDVVKSPQRRASLKLIGGLAAGALAAVLGLGYFAWQKPSGDGPSATTASGSVVAETDAYGERILITGGKFKMGRDEGPVDERPAHEVTVKDFWLDKYEVTNQQYKRFVDETKRTPPAHWANEGVRQEFPVTFVTWEDATTYAAWAGKRLPTEEEWEYAARSGAQGLLYPWGNEWRSGNAGVGISELAPVRDFVNDKSAAFGVMGLAGNVSEWVESLYRRYDNGALIFKDICPDCRVYRGGNFKSKSTFSTTTSRLADFPKLPAAQKQREGYETKVFPRVGFRCAKDK